MPRILICEDDTVFRTLVETMVRLEGNEVHLAANGETGLAQAKNKKPDIILSDIQMPGMTGIELVRAVRQDPDLAHTYIILITGTSGQDAKLDALRAGADDFLEKPSTRDTILGRIEIAQKVMAVQQGQRAAEARAASLEAVPKAVGAELDGLDTAIASAEAAIAKKSPADLVAAVKMIKDAAVKARGACGGGASSGGSWL
jgi:CheY-like chemotaxis protein